MNTKRPRTLRWVVLGVALVVVLIVVLGQVKIDGAPVIDSPTTLLVQIVASAGIVAAAVIPTLRRAANDASVAKEQTANSHKTNLREELDERHDEIIAAFRMTRGDVQRVLDTQHEHTARMDRIQSDQRGIRRDVGRNMDMTLKLSDRVTKVDDRLRTVELASKSGTPVILKAVPADSVARENEGE